MAISGNVLGFISGAAEQFTKNKETFKKELRENKRRQKEWLNTYGSKVINENKQQQESVELALEELEARGLKTPDALQLLQKHGVNAVLELNKTVKDYESTNSTRVDADLMNKIWKAAEDFTPTSQSFEEAVSKVFGTNKAGSTTPVIQESEERSFFDKIKDNLSGAYEAEEYDDFLSDPSEGMGGYTINELRAMSAASPSMVGSGGAAVFDRSVLRGSEPSAGEARLWKDTVPLIVREALKNLSPEDREAVEMTEADTASGFKVRNVDDIFFDLSDPDGVYFDAFSEATRKIHEQNPFSNNRSATGAYGGQDALNAILNPKTIEELFEATGRDPSELQLFATDEEALEFFKRNAEEFVYVGTDSDKELIARPNNLPVTPDPETDDDDDLTVDDPELPVEEGTYNTDDLTLKVQPTVAPEGIPKRPEPIYRGEEKKLLEKPRNKRDIDDWDDQYGDKYNPDATYKIVRPQGPRPEDTNSREYYEYELWDATYGDTHDPLTGYPLIEGLDKTLIPNSGETE